MLLDREAHCTTEGAHNATTMYASWLLAVSFVIHHNNIPAYIPNYEICTVNPTVPNKPLLKQKLLKIPFL